jgi:hypothetical protein
MKLLKLLNNGATDGNTSNRRLKDRQRERQIRR